MNVLPAIGTIFGSGLAAKVMSYGRSKSYVIACVLGIFGASFTFIENWYVFLFAKFVVGASIGLMGVTVARFIEEYVPLAWFGTSQAISLAFLQAGIFLATILGAILPDDEDNEALKDNLTYRIIFAVQPIMFILCIVLFYIFVRTDAPRFYIQRGQEDKAKAQIEKMYITNGNKEKINNIYLSEKKACTQTYTEVGEGAGGQVTMKQALWTDPQYTRSSWIAILIMAFQCLTGYYAIIAYSSNLLEKDFNNGDTRINARQGVFLINGFNLLGAICAIYFIAKVGRRKIILIGQGGIAVSLVGIAIVSTMESHEAHVALLALICIVAFLFQFTLGPLAPLYAAEVCTDVALGAVMITEDVVVLIQDFITPVLLSSPMQSVGVFLMYGLFSVFGFIFVYLYVPETMGLSEQEKREIFLPGAKAGRVLKNDEDCQAGYEHRSDATI